MKNYRKGWVNKRNPRDFVERFRIIDAHSFSSNSRLLFFFHHRFRRFIFPQQIIQYPITQAVCRLRSPVATIETHKKNKKRVQTTHTDIFGIFLSISISSSIKFHLKLKKKKWKRTRFDVALCSSRMFSFSSRVGLVRRLEFSQFQFSSCFLSLTSNGNKRLTNGLLCKVSNMTRSVARFACSSKKTVHLFPANFNRQYYVTKLF